MIKLLVTDLDGTIIANEDGRPTERVMRAFAACQRAGFIFCVATGRIRPGTPDLGQDFTICHGGTLVLEGDRYLHRSVVPQSEARRLWDWAVARDIPAHFFGEHRWAATYSSERTERLTAWLGKAPEPGPEWDVPLISVRSGSLELQNAFPHLHVEGEGDWAYVRAAKADKGTALRILMDRMGIAPDEVMCFGDEMNDYAMFTVAGHAVAVENGRQELKAVATRVAPSVQADGVAQVLEELLRSFEKEVSH